MPLAVDFPQVQLVYNCERANLLVCLGYSLGFDLSEVYVGLGQRSMSLRMPQIMKAQQPTDRESAELLHWILGIGACQLRHYMPASCLLTARQLASYFFVGSQLYFSMHACSQLASYYCQLQISYVARQHKGIANLLLAVRPGISIS